MIATKPYSTCRKRGSYGIDLPEQLIRFAGVSTRTSGATGAAGVAELSGSLLLASNNFYRQFTDDPAVTASAAVLPQMQGAGWVRDLREAMSLGTPAAQALQDKVSAFASGTTRDAQMAVVDALESQIAIQRGAKNSHAASGKCLFFFKNENGISQLGIANINMHATHSNACARPFAARRTLCRI